MQVTIDIKDERLVDKVLWLLNSLKKDGLEIVKNSKEKLNKSSGIDFSSYKIDSLKDVDGLEFQKKIRDEW